MKYTLALGILLSVAFAKPIVPDFDIIDDPNPRGCGSSENGCDEGFECRPLPMCSTGWAGLEPCPSSCQPKVPKRCGGIMGVECKPPAQCIAKVDCEDGEGEGVCPSYCETPSNPSASSSASSSSTSSPSASPSAPAEVHYAPCDFDGAVCPEGSNCGMRPDCDFINKPDLCGDVCVPNDVPLSFE